MNDQLDRPEQKEPHEPLTEVEPVTMPEETDLLDPETPQDDQPEDEPEGLKRPDRRQTFQTLGVLLVWYYIYQLFKGLFTGEITGNQRIFAIVAVALMTVANLWLSVHLGKRYWEQYKENRDAQDM
ncbi:MAG TPA: hypothetical protein GXZ89_03755 [Fastidiosipila sp.]|jgi:hypothetical protein|nr:hypothetical protein [Fastidiosipila sp.]